MSRILSYLKAARARLLNEVERNMCQGRILDLLLDMRKQKYDFLVISQHTDINDHIKYRSYSAR